MSENDKTRQQLSAYLDGELSDADAAKVAAALKADPELADELSQLETVRKLVKSLPRQQAGESFVADVIARAERRDLIGAAEHAERPATNWVRYVASAAVIMIVVGIGVVFTVVLRRDTFLDTMSDAHEPADRIAMDDASKYAQKKVPLSGEVAGGPTRGAPVTDGVARRVASERERGDREPDFAADKLAPLASAPARSPLAVRKGEPSEEVSAGTAFRAVHGADKDSTVVADRLAGQPKTDLKAAEVLDESALRFKDSEAGSTSHEVRSTVVAGRGDGKHKGEALDLGAAVTDQPLKFDASVAYGRLRRRGALAESMPYGRSSRIRQESPAVERAFAEARREDIYTDDLPRAQKFVETVLIANDVIPLRIAPLASNRIMIANQQTIGQASYFQVIPATEKQVQYMAYVTTEQMTRIRRSLSVVRMNTSADLERFNKTRLAYLRELRGVPASRPAQPIASVMMKRRTYVAIEEGRGGTLSLARDVSTGPVAKVAAAKPSLSGRVESETSDTYETRAQIALVFGSGGAVDKDSAAVNPLLISVNYRERAATQPAPSSRPVSRPPPIAPKGPASLPTTMPR